MRIHSVEGLFEFELRDTYYTEIRMVTVLHQLAREAHDERVRVLFAEHRDETVEQIRRIEEVFVATEGTVDAEPSPAIDGIVQEKTVFEQHDSSPEMVDQFDLMNATKFEMLEIACYEALIDMAERTGKTAALPLLRENLAEEQRMLERVRRLAHELEPQLWTRTDQRRQKLSPS